MNRNDLGAAWVALASAVPDPGEVRLAPLGVSTSTGVVHAGRDGTGRLHLLVPIPAGTHLRPDRRSKGVAIERNEFVIGGDRVVTIDIFCNEPRLNDIFEHLALEVLDRLEAAPDQAVGVCTDVLNRWRALFERRREALSAGALEGLFGELWLLRRMVALDPAHRIDHWEGPTGARHDFRRSGVALEVKATTRREGLFIEIHGAQQLEPEAGSDLYLVAVRLEESPSGETIAELIRDLGEAGADSVQLTRLLSQVGWDATAEQDERFSVLETRIYDITDEFPRIIPASFKGGGVPLGVIRLRYEVDLTGPTPVALSLTDADHLVEVVSTAA